MSTLLESLTIAEWKRYLHDIGCIVCINTLGVSSPSDIHHIHKNGRRIDDLHTIQLCPMHHRAGFNNKQFVSRHPWKREFESRYGTEWELFEQIKQHVKVLYEMSKDV